MKKKILILGATGFLGYHLAKKCLDLKWNVHSVSKKNPQKTRFLKNVKYFYFDLSKKKNFK
jgi:nucleoside-diphosphate-sugar epimerase